MVPHTIQTRKEEGTGERILNRRGVVLSVLEDMLMSLIGDSGSYYFSGDFSTGKIMIGHDLANLTGGGDG